MTSFAKIKLYKTISYRLISSFIGSLFLWKTTGNWIVVGGFSAMELIWKPIQYWLHEKAWQRAEKKAIEKDDKRKA